MQLGRALVLILKQGDAIEYRQALQGSAGILAQHGREPVADGEPVGLSGAALLAGANHEHLHQAALDGAVEVGVGLDAIHHDHAVGLNQIARQPDRRAETALCRRHRLHGGDDRRPDGLLGDAQSRKSLRLSGGRRPSMAAHAGHHERLTPGLSDEARQRAQDGDEIAHTTAAGGQSHPRTRDDAFARAHAGPLIGERRRRIELRPLPGTSGERGRDGAGCS